METAIRQNQTGFVESKGKKIIIRVPIYVGYVASNYYYQTNYSLIDANQANRTRVADEFKTRIAFRRVERRFGTDLIQQLLKRRLGGRGAVNLRTILVYLPKNTIYPFPIYV